MTPPRWLGPWLALAVVTAPAAALDVSLEDAIGRAVKTSAETQSQRFQLQSGVLKNQLSLRRYLPSLSVQNNQSQSVRYNQDDIQSVSWSATVKQPLFLGVADLSTADLANQDLELAQIGVQTAEEAARDAAWQAYQGLWMELQKLTVYQGLAGVAVEQLKITETERHVGSARDVDLVETQLQAKKAAQQVKSQELAVKTAEYTLRGLLGIDPTSPVSWTTDFEDEGYRWPTAVTIASLQARAQASSLDLKKARAQIQKLVVQKQAADLDIVPTLDLETSLSVSGTNYPLDKPGYSVKVNLRWPFRYLPVQFTLGYTSNPGSDFGTNNSTQTGVPDDLSFLVNADTLAFQLDAAAQAADKQVRDLNFTIETQVRQILLQADALATQAELLDLGRTKATILKTQVALGEAKRLDYLKSEFDLVDQKLTALDQEKTLLVAERTLEKTVGLELGTIKTYRRKP